MAKERAVNRYRLSVPEADESVNQWIEKQNNLSFSLRCVIKDIIRRYGITDVTCINFAADAFLGESDTSVSQSVSVTQNADTQIKQEMSVTEDAKAEPVPVKSDLDTKAETVLSDTSTNKDMSATLESLLR